MDAARDNSGAGAQMRNPEVRYAPCRIPVETALFPQHKLDGASYAADKYVSSFIGLAPASAPRLIIAVMIDEPRAGQYYGGTVAAPVFSSVMAGSLRMLGVKPDAPLNNVVLPPPGAPVVREEV